MRNSLGHRSPQAQPFYVRLSATSAADSIGRLRVQSGPGQIAAADKNVWMGQAGGGRVASAVFNLSYTDEQAGQTRPLHVMWADLLNTVIPTRFGAYREMPEPQSKTGALKILFGRETSGFSFTATQLFKRRAGDVGSCL